MSDVLQPNKQLLQQVIRQLKRSFVQVDPASVHFLAAGEYTMNYRAATSSGDVVLRIVTGSQMGLGVEEQVHYEAGALELLAETARTPQVIGIETDPPELPYPYMLIEFLPGRPLDYRQDIEMAARCVARIHRAGIPEAHHLQDHRNPVRSILDEVDRLIGDAPESTQAMQCRWDAVALLLDRVRAMPRTEHALASCDLAIINTDLNSHNFIVDGGRIWLIDWEKARIGPTVLDLAHFLLPTTTLWRDRGAAQLSAEDERRFIDAYLGKRPELDRERYSRALAIAKRIAALRAIAWCAWALAVAESGDRAIVNEETLAKCRIFTSPEFIDELVRDLWT